MFLFSDNDSARYNRRVVDKSGFCSLRHQLSICRAECKHDQPQHRRANGRQERFVGGGCVASCSSLQPAQRFSALTTASRGVQVLSVVWDRRGWETSDVFAFLTLFSFWTVLGFLQSHCLKARHSEFLNVSLFKQQLPVFLTFNCTCSELPDKLHRYRSEVRTDWHRTPTHVATTDKEVNTVIMKKKRSAHW